MRAHISLSIGLLLILSGCMSEQAVVSKYYTIEWQIDQTAAEDIPVPVVINKACEIDQVEIHPLYEGNQIVNRSDSHEITYYKYHQWAVRPSVAIREFIRYHLERSRTFESVSTRFSRTIPEYRFETSINQLEIFETDDTFIAHVNIEFRIIDNSNDRVLLEYEADGKEPLPKKDLNLFASTVSKLIYKELQAFISQIKRREILFENSKE